MDVTTLEARTQSSNGQTDKWSDHDHIELIMLVSVFGRNFKQISQTMCSQTSKKTDAQCRSHYQDYERRLRQLQEACTMFLSEDVNALPIPTNFSLRINYFIQEREQLVALARDR